MAATANFLLITVSLVRGQDWQFTFDANGNLVSEVSASTGLPQILAHPQHQVVEPGGLVSFFVVAKDTRGLAYQWRTNGVSFSGATNDTLLLTNVSAASEGLYSVVLVNGSGSVTSAPAMLWLDTDGDGLADSWEQSYFGGLGQNPYGDFDGDGVSNLNEFDDGTNPTNSVSAEFRLTVMNDGGVVTVAPTKLTYTNGEAVTVTASAYAPEVFRGWTGDIASGTNVLNLVMTNSKTLFAHFQPTAIAWTNTAGGDWHNPLNWSPNLVPISGDDIGTLPAVTITVNAPAVCRNVNFSGGTLTGTGDLSIHGTANWTSGSFTGSGRIIIASNATLTINSPSFTLTLARILENAGTVVWTGAAGMNLNNVVITNRPGALFHAQSALTMGSIGGSPRFDNAGTFRKSVSAGTTTFNFAFNNYGEMDLQTGTLNHTGSFINNGSVTVAGATHHRMAGGGSASGTVNALASSLVEWVGGTFTLTAGAQLNGSGTYWLNGAAVNFDTDVAVQNLELHNGTFGGSGVVTISNAMTWTGGSLSGSGRTIVAPSATLTVNNPFFTINLNRPLENGGTVLWTGAAVYVNNVAITNRVGALFHVQSAPSFLNNGGAPRFDNAGIFRKSANSGTATINIPFNNYSTVDVQTGTLLNNSSLLNNGSVTLAPATTHRMTAGGSSSGTFTNSPTGLMEWTANTFTLNSGAQLNGDGLYRINGGALNCTADVTVQNLDLPGGALDGSGVVTISNAMTWTGGSLSGSGRTIVAPGATMTINNPFFTINLNRPLENGGTVLWTGAAVYVNNVVITNRVGALFHVQSAPTFYNNGGAPRFDNAGTFRKSANSGTTTFNIPFNNYGTTDIRSGILALNGGFTAGSGALLNCALGGTTAGTGFGQLQKSGAITLDGALRLELTNGFVPGVGNAFTVVSATTRSGTFSSFSYPSNLVAMQLSNTASSVIAVVTAYSTSGPPAFVTNLPSTQVFYEGRTAVQPVFTAGTSPKTYQWTRNGTNLSDGDRISGAQSSALMISNFGMADVAIYQVNATNADGGTASTASFAAVQAVPKLNVAGAGWTLQGTTLPPMGSNTVTLTSGLGSTSRSVFYNAPLYVPAFAASFIYRDVGGGGADGITFCLQNDPRGPTALGGFGYGGITPSVALVMNIYLPYTVGIALRTNGTFPSTYSSTAPVNIASGNPIHVSLLYTGAVLRVTLQDLTTSSSFATNFALNLPASLGAETAFVGFTGGDGGVASTQVVSNYTFVPLTSLVAEQPAADALALSWPVTIGGYTMQSKSNLAAGLGVWQSVTNSTIQTSNRNLITITPLVGSQNYRLKIDLNE